MDKETLLIIYTAGTAIAGFIILGMCFKTIASIGRMYDRKTKK